MDTYHLILEIIYGNIHDTFLLHCHITWHYDILLKFYLEFYYTYYVPNATIIVTIAH